MGTSRFRDGPLWAACLAAAAVPWVVAPGLRDAWALPKAVAAGLCAAGGLAAWAAAGAPSLALGVEVPAAAVLGAALLAAALSVDRAAAFLGADMDLSAGLCAVAAGVAGLYLGAAASRTRPDAPARAAAALAWGAAPMGAFAAFQAWGPAAPQGFFSPVLGRAVGTFGHPVAMGAYMALAAPAALAAATEPGAPRRWLGWSCLAACLAGLAAAGGRSSWLAACAACGTVAVLRTDGRARRAAAAAAAAVALGGVLLAGLRLGAAGQRAGGRPEAWSIAVKAFRARPLSGWGPGTFPILYRALRGGELAAVEGGDVAFPHAHNDLLEALAAAGLAGAAAWVWLQLAALRRLGRGAAAAAGGAACWIVQSKLNLPPLPVTFVAALGVGAALACAGAPSRGGLPAAALAVFACAAMSLPLLARVPAERADHLGRLARAQGRARDAAAEFERAVAAAPGAVAFRADLMNVLWDGAQAAAGPDRTALLDRARDVALEGARRRPAEPEFARLLGLAELRRAAWGGADSLPAARAALEAARAADPFDPRTTRTLAELGALERGGSVGL